MNVIYLHFFQIRENYVNFFKDLLNKNLDKCNIVDPPKNSIDEDDVKTISADLEYNVFTNSKSITVYRRNISKLVCIFLVI